MHSVLDELKKMESSSEKVNYLKHHGGLNVQTDIFVLVDQRLPFRMSISSFTLNKKTYPKCDVLTYLNDTNDTIDKSIRYIECALNEHICKLSN